MTLYKEFPLNKRQGIQAKKYLSARNHDQLWKYIDSLKLSLPEGEDAEFVSSPLGMFIRIWKPKNIKNDNRPKI